MRRALLASGKVGAVVAASPFATRPLAVAADEEALPFRDGAIDLVVSALSLQFVKRLTRKSNDSLIVAPGLVSANSVG